MVVYGRHKEEPSMEDLTKGELAVDWHDGINFRTMRQKKRARAISKMEENGLDAILAFQAPNIRYLTSLHMSSFNIGVGGISYSLLTADDYLVHWTSADRAYHNRNEAPWINEVCNSSPGTGAIPQAAHSKEAEKFLRDKQVKGIVDKVEELGLKDGVIGIDSSLNQLESDLEANGIDCSHRGSWALHEARIIKTEEEIECLRTISSIVDGGFKTIKEHAETGIRENELWGEVVKYLNNQGADVGGGYLASGPRTWPKPHGNTTTRRIRPGDVVYSDIYHSRFAGYNSCYYRTFSIGEPSKRVKDKYEEVYTWLYDAIEKIEPGVTTDEIAEVWPTEEEIWEDYGVDNAWETSTNNWAHGIGLSLYEPPFIWRGISLEYPMELKEGMTFAIETQDAVGDGQGIRLEEMCVIRSDGVEVLSQWPIEEITICDV